MRFKCECNGQIRQRLMVNIICQQLHHDIICRLFCKNCKFVKITEFRFVFNIIVAESWPGTWSSSRRFRIVYVTKLAPMYTILSR